MPSFISNGPEIPERLLEQHEDGKVVFFCGAGISAPAGLPNFKGLVSDIYKILNTKKIDLEVLTFKNDQFDSTLDLLERRHVQGRYGVRRALMQALAPIHSKRHAYRTHKALLHLASDSTGNTKIVTTNYDHIFERSMKSLKLNVESYSAPFLPIPKPSKWNGVVYLHGLLPKKDDETSLNRLVLTSGDFGLAYLTERWAARFVSELFRNYTICFVGYGINDPVLRYMMDALAADELQGVPREESFAFASYKSGDQHTAENEWKAKGVTPLLYEVTPEDSGHLALHDTLNEWAKTYRDGAQGKEMIITKHASSAPLTDSKTDYAVGRVLWALTDDLAAKHFSEMNPVPPFDWIDALANKQFHHEDLNRFGVTPNKQVDEKLEFSVIDRPTPYANSPNMNFVGMGPTDVAWDPVMLHLSNWLLRHLNNKKLILWISSRGGQLHERFNVMVRQRIKEFDRLKKSKNKKEIEETLKESPDAIPDGVLRRIWDLILAGRLKSNKRRIDFYGWADRLSESGITPEMRAELRDMLRPCIVLRKPIKFPSDES